MRRIKKIAIIPVVTEQQVSVFGIKQFNKFVEFSKFSRKTLDIKCKETKMASITSEIRIINIIGCKCGSLYSEPKKLLT